MDAPPGTREPAAPEALRLERIERLEDVRDEWRRLADATGHPFATWEWNEGWWRRFARGRSLCTYAGRDQRGEVLAILPLYVAAVRPARVARFLGHGDLSSPLCAARHRALAAAALGEVTGREDGCRFVLAERLPNEHGWGELVGGSLLGTQVNPVLRVDGMSWEDFLASRSRNFRDQVRRRERRLVREQGLEFRLADDPERLPDDMRTLFRLHAAQWGRQSTGVFQGALADFHREFAARALERGWLRLWLAEAEGEAVAAWYGWRFADSYWYYQAGRDPRLDRFSVGFVLMAHTVREACRDGVASYQFLAGAEGYKWRFASEDPGADSRVLGSGALGRLGCRAIALATSLPGPGRRLVARITG